MAEGFNLVIDKAAGQHARQSVDGFHLLKDGLLVIRFDSDY
jgi:hypothetical protein